MQRTSHFNFSIQALKMSYEKRRFRKKSSKISWTQKSLQEKIGDTEWRREKAFSPVRELREDYNSNNYSNKWGKKKQKKKAP